MKTVGIRELKNHLSGVLQLVRGGDEILVTDRGKVVAELRPPTPPAARPSRHPGLATLARRGSLTIGQANDPALYVSLPPLLPAGSAARLLAEERQEREER